MRRFSKDRAGGGPGQRARGQIGVARSAAYGGPQPRRHRRDFARAEQLYQAADTLAGKLLYVEGLVYAREQRGISQERQRALHRAVQSWEAAAGICRTAGMTPQLRTNLGHLLRGYRAQGKLADVDRVELELRQLKAEERSR